MVVKRATLWVVNIFFPPLAVFLLCGAGPDLFVNSLLFLCAVLPAHLHASYILHTYFHRRKKVRRNRFPGGHVWGVYSEKIESGGADAREVRRLARLERVEEMERAKRGKKRGRVRSLVGRVLRPCGGGEGEYEMVEERRPGFIRHASAPPDMMPFQQQQRRSRPASIREAVVAALVGADGPGSVPLSRTATMPLSLSRTQSRPRHQPQYQPEYQSQYQPLQPPEQPLLPPQPSRHPSRRRTHSADPTMPRRHSTRARQRPDPATLLQRRASARPSGRASAVAVERWMDGWHHDDDDGGADGREREPLPLLPPRRDDERVLATGAWDGRGGADEGAAPRRRRTLHRVEGRASLA
jgi:uncharacterized membrane protein YqaE (UPF0057 family)